MQTIIQKINSMGLANKQKKEVLQLMMAAQVLCMMQSGIYRPILNMSIEFVSCLQFPYVETDLKIPPELAKLIGLNMDAENEFGQSVKDRKN